METNFKVPYTKILEINPHPNADRLEMAKCYGFDIVVQKDRYKVGDNVFYIPIDSVLCPELEAILFPKDSKITLHKSRVKQIKIRSVYSQGMLVDPGSVYDLLAKRNLSNITFIFKSNNISKLVEEQDYAEALGITKYEPLTPKFQQTAGPGGRKLKAYANPAFRLYNGVPNVKWSPNAFKDGEEVVMQSKLHGSHIRFAKAPFAANTLWKKILKFFGFAPKYEFCIGSNNVELTNKKNYTGFYGEDIYSKAAEKLNLMDKIKEGEFWHGELIGEGIQKNYSYGHKEHHIVVFDCRVLQEDGTQKWMDPEEVEKLAKERGFDFVPVVYKGPFSKEVMEFHTSDVEVYYPKDTREGLVVKARYNYDNEQNKRAYKSINPKYLEKDNSDFH